MLTVQELVKRLSAKGYRLTRRRCLKWIEDGLLPHPTRRGRGRGRGVAFLWDDGDRVLRQAERVAQGLRWNRRVSNLFLPLWVMGYDVPLDRVKERLLRWYDVPATLSLLQERYGQRACPERSEGDDSLKDVISRLAVWGVKGGQFSWLKGGEHFTREEVAELFLNVLHVPKYRPPSAILKRAARLTGMKTELLRRLTPYLSRPALAQALGQAEDDVLLWARRVLHRCTRLARLAAPDALADLESTFTQDPNMLFNLAANSGAFLIPVLVKLHTDGHAALIEDLLADWEARAGERNKSPTTSRQSKESLTASGLFR